MTIEDIIRMAREAEFKEGEIAHMGDNFIRFAALVAAKQKEATDAAYKERNQLVALLAILFPSGKKKTAIEGWDEAWHGCVYIDFPWGQASWHYHINDEWMFELLPEYQGQWDGHTTQEKYSAIASAIKERNWL